jgi:hypothetical protein
MRHFFFYTLFCCFFTTILTAQISQEFTYVEQFGSSSARLYDFAANSDGTTFLSIAIDEGGGVGWSQIVKVSPNGDSTQVVWTNSGDPISTNFLPLPDGFVTYGVSAGCDLGLPAYISKWNNASELKWEVPYNQLIVNWQFDTLTVLPGPDQSLWVFQRNTPPVQLDSNGTITGMSAEAEPLFTGFIALPNQQYLTWNPNSLIRYHETLDAKTEVVTPHPVKDAALLSNGQIAVLTTHELWVLDTNLTINGQWNLPATVVGQWIGVEAQDSTIYLLNSGVEEVALFQWSADLNQGNTTLVSAYTGFKVKQFACRNGQLYLAGSNSRGVAGLKKQTLTTPLYELHQDVGITVVQSPAPIEIWPAFGGAGYGARWKNIEVMVTNFGSDTLHSFNINCILSYFSSFCFQTWPYLATIDSLHIPPGASTTVTIPELTWGSISNFSTLTSFNLCLWTTFPNDSLDAHPDNDRYCGTFSTLVDVKNPAIPEPLLSIQPNPAHETTTIVLPETLSLPAELVLYNAIGTEVRREVVQSSTPVLARGDLPPGIYQVLVRTSDARLLHGQVIFMPQGKN